MSAAVALTLFNRGRPPAQAYTERDWRSFCRARHTWLARGGRRRATARRDGLCSAIHRAPRARRNSLHDSVRPRHGAVRDTAPLAPHQGSRADTVYPATRKHSSLPQHADRRGHEAALSGGIPPDPSACASPHTPRRQPGSAKRSVKISWPTRSLRPRVSQRPGCRRSRSPRRESRGSVPCGW